MTIARQISVVALPLLTGAAGFLAGTVMFAEGPAVEVILASDNAPLEGTILVSDDLSVSGNDIAALICSSDTAVASTASTYTLFGKASAFRFKCAEPGKVIQ